MAAVEAGLAAAQFEAGLAAAQAEVGRLQAQLVAAKATVNWYYRAIRRRTQKQLEASHAEKDEKKEQAAPKSPVDSGSPEEPEPQEEVPQKNSDASGSSSDDQQPAEEAQQPQQPQQPQEEAAPALPGQMVRVEDAGPAKKERKKYAEPVPADTCPACDNERRRGWSGCKHKRELPSCRLHKGEARQLKQPRRE